MNQQQNRLYWGLWKKVQEALAERGFSKGDMETRRRDMHVEALGYERSSRELSQEEFTAVKKAFLSEIEGGDFAIAMASVMAPKDRWIFSIKRLATALAKGEEYVETIVRRMNAEGRIDQPWRMEGRDPDRDYRHLAADGRLARQEIILADLVPTELMKVFVAMKKQCRREWPTKGDLLAAIRTFGREHELDEETARKVVRSALSRETDPDLDALKYEALLIVMAALRPLAMDVPF